MTNPRERLHPMTQVPSTAIRVFVSSTFVDMQAERQYLVDEVFPQIRRQCALLGIDFETIDLRWGVSGENSDVQVLDYCLDQINGCLPYLLALIGGRYGWVPGTKPEIAPMLADDERECSVTELEIRRFERGVRERDLQPGTLVGLRREAYTEALGVAEPLSDEVRARLAALRARFAPPAANGFDYGDLATLGDKVYAFFIAKAEALAAALAGPRRLIDARQDEYTRLLRINGVAHVPMMLEERDDDGVWQPVDEDALMQRFAAKRLHFVTGAPGSGKTALSLEVARRWQANGDERVVRLHIGATGEISLNGVVRDLHALADAGAMRHWADVLMAELNSWSTPTLIILDGVERIAGWDQRMPETLERLAHQPHQLMLLVEKLLHAHCQPTVLLTLDAAVQPDNEVGQTFAFTAISMEEDPLPFALYRISPLDAGRRERFATDYFAFRGKQVTDAQLDRIRAANVIDTFEALHLACDRLRRFGKLQRERGDQDAFILEQVATLFGQSPGEVAAALVDEAAHAFGLGAAHVHVALQLLAVTHYGLPAPVLVELVGRQAGEGRFTLRDWAVLEGMFGPLLVRSGTRYAFKNGAVARTVVGAIDGADLDRTRGVLVDYLAEQVAGADLAGLLHASLDTVFANELALQLSRLPQHPAWRHLLAPKTMLAWFARDWEVTVVEFNRVANLASFQQAYDAADEVDGAAVVAHFRAEVQTYLETADAAGRTHLWHVLNAADRVTGGPELGLHGKASVAVAATCEALRGAMADARADR